MSQKQNHGKLQHLGRLYIKKSEGYPAVYTVYSGHKQNNDKHYHCNNEQRKRKLVQVVIIKI